MCITPIKVKNKKTGEIIPVPCGKCGECLKRKGDEWKFRCSVEAACSDSVIFITLTYDEFHLPRAKNGKSYPSKGDLQHFIHQLRKFIEPNRIRYFIASEYGPQTHRLHYHGLIFNFPYEQYNPVEYITKAWGYGYVELSEANEERISYVCGYMLNTLKGKDKPLTLMSTRPAIGSEWLTPQRVKYLLNTSSSVIHVNGYYVTIPRYYLRKLQESNPEWYEDTKQLRKDYLVQRRERYLQELNDMYPDGLGEASLIQEKQRQFNRKVDKHNRLI